MVKKIDYASLYTLRKDGRYVGTYHDETGRHYVYDRDPEKLHQKLQQISEPKMPEVITFGMALEEWEREHREEIEPRTWKNYEPHVKALAARYGDMPFRDVLGLDVQRELAQAKARGLSRTVVNTIRSIFNMVFDYGIIHGYVQYNPSRAVKLPKGLKAGKRKGLTDDEIITICKNIDAPFGLFPFLLLCTGMRKSEALALSWSRDIDFENNEISVQASRDTSFSDPKLKDPKTAAGYRQIPIIPVLLDQLKKAKRNSTSDLLFPAPASNRGGVGGGMIKDRQYDGLWDRYCQAVGFWADGGHTVTAHQIRHATATLMFETGVDEKTAQKVLGHSRIEITREIYTELREKQQARSMDKFAAGLSKLLSNQEKRL